MIVLPRPATTGGRTCPLGAREARASPGAAVAGLAEGEVQSDDRGRLLGQHLGRPCLSPPQRHAAPLFETWNATTESAAFLCSTHLRDVIGLLAPAEVPGPSNLSSEPLAFETPKSADWSQCQHAGIVD